MSLPTDPETTLQHAQLLASVLDDNTADVVVAVSDLPVPADYGLAAQMTVIIENEKYTLTLRPWTEPTQVV